ncbi:MAG TPA: hypothetical protein VK427_07400 [Kofleriaceae bacterium]|nr:hypothetical protein [Kofleriaceae bacterium]
MTVPGLPTATLEPVRFGEFLRDRHRITDEQWLAALAAHWSSPTRRKVGAIIVEQGFLSIDIVEAEARAFHDELDVVEIVDADGFAAHEDELDVPRSEKTTLPATPRHQAHA